MHHDADAHLKPVDEQTIFSICRPHPSLLTLYVLRCLFTTVAFPFVFLPCFFRYITLRYRFDEEGVAVSWGFFFRKETYLTYSRIQDIHVSRGILERWLGLGTVEIQTAAGSSQAVEAIVGVTEFDSIRNFLYARMRGHEFHGKQAAAPGSPTDSVDELLREIRDELHAIRTLVQEQRHV